jgi:hypothetical protein
MPHNTFSCFWAVVQVKQRLPVPVVGSEGEAHSKETFIPYFEAFSREEVVGSKGEADPEDDDIFCVSRLFSPDPVRRTR